MGQIIEGIDLRPGNAYIRNGNIYRVIENSFMKTAQSKGIVKCKVKNLRTGAITIEVLTDAKVEKADLNSIIMTFSYIDGENYVFIDSTTFETVEISKSRLGKEAKYITDGLEVRILKYGEEVLDIILPDQVVVLLVDAEEAVRGNTASGSAMKKAWTENGYEVTVPQFIKKGEKILISTSTDEYVGRAKDE
ncbi:MAG: elongation factor P [Mycoplasmataceae bacterium]|nr:elongation factor P [Mycoplasmataceae bacterium]